MIVLPWARHPRVLAAAAAELCARLPGGPTRARRSAVLDRAVQAGAVQRLVRTLGAGGAAIARGQLKLSGLLHMNENGARKNDGRAPRLGEHAWGGRRGRADGGAQCAAGAGARGRLHHKSWLHHKSGFDPIRSIMYSLMVQVGAGEGIAEDVAELGGAAAAQVSTAPAPSPRRCAHGSDEVGTVVMRCSEEG